MLGVHYVRGLARVLEDRVGHEVALGLRRHDAGTPGGSASGARVDLVLEEPSARRRDALEQHLAYEVVPEAEAEAVDAEQPPLAEAFELLGRAPSVRPEHGGEPFRVEGLLEG